MKPYQLTAFFCGAPRCAATPADVAMHASVGRVKLSQVEFQRAAGTCFNVICLSNAACQCCFSKILFTYKHRANMKVLVINPNSTQSVTDGLQAALDPVAPPGVELGYFTAPPHAPPSSHTFHLSCLTAVYCFEKLEKIGAFEKYDAFLVCCCKSPINFRFVT